MTRLMRFEELTRRTGHSRSRLYREIKEGKFPKPVKVGPHAVAWLESEVDDWIAARVAERDRDNAG